MFWLVDGLENATKKEYRLLLPYLSDQRLEKAEKYRFFPDKMSSATVFVLLRCMLDHSIDWRGDCDFVISESGKPRLLSRGDVFFSLSHDRKGVGAALSDRTIGADVQALFPYEKALAERILSVRERAYFDRFGPDDELLTRMWTMKESLGKKRGDGVFSVMTSTDLSGAKEGSGVYDGEHFTVGRKGDLFYAVCSDEKEEVRFLTLRDLIRLAGRLPVFQS